MVRFILIRGAPAVGKTSITKALLKTLKREHKKNCAYICEDNFRKEMQFKYKSRDLQAHLNSVEIITTVIQKLLELDSYDYIFLEGQFRYKKVIENYKHFIKEKKLDYILFQFNLSLEEMKKRDVELRNTKSKNIEEVKRDIDAFTPKEAIIIRTDKNIKICCENIMRKLLE